MAAFYFSLICSLSRPAGNKKNQHLLLNWHHIFLRLFSFDLYRFGVFFMFLVNVGQSLLPSAPVQKPNSDEGALFQTVSI